MTNIASAHCKAVARAAPKPAYRSQTMPSAAARAALSAQHKAVARAALRPHAQRSGQSSAQRTAQSSGQSSAQARNHHLRDVVRRKLKTEARSVSSHTHVTRSTNDRHRAHPTPRQVDHEIQLSRWGPEQPPPCARRGPGLGASR